MTIYCCGGRARETARERQSSLRVRHHCGCALTASARWLFLFLSLAGWLACFSSLTRFFGSLAASRGRASGSCERCFPPAHPQKFTGVPLVAGAELVGKRMNQRAVKLCRTVERTRERANCGQLQRTSKCELNFSLQYRSSLVHLRWFIRHNAHNTPSNAAEHIEAISNTYYSTRLIPTLDTRTKKCTKHRFSNMDNIYSDKTNGTKTETNIAQQAGNEMADHLINLDQTVDDISREQIEIRDKLREIVLRMKAEVEQMEYKQKKIQDCLKQIQHI